MTRASCLRSEFCHPPKWGSTSNLFREESDESLECRESGGSVYVTGLRLSFLTTRCATCEWKVCVDFRKKYSYLYHVLHYQYSVPCIAHCQNLGTGTVRVADVEQGLPCTTTVLEYQVPGTVIRWWASSTSPQSLNKSETQSNLGIAHFANTHEHILESYLVCYQANDTRLHTMQLCHVLIRVCESKSGVAHTGEIVFI
jgi:hypothetical protein